MSLRRRMGMAGLSALADCGGSDLTIWSAPCTASEPANECRVFRIPVRRRRAGPGVAAGAVAALMFAVAAVGGATRLTDSGLSIVEWKPVTGVLPPLSEHAWQAEFEKYKTDPAIPRAQPRHEPRRVQDHLLVGMGAPAAGAADRRRCSCCRSCGSSGAAGSSRACGCGCGRCSGSARCRARSAGGWCRPASPGA